MSNGFAREKSPMSDQHKEALAVGREQGRSVRRYLEALELYRPKRGRKRTPESVRRQLKTVEERIENADPLSRLHLLQERMDLEAELAKKEHGVNIAELEEEFIKSAKEYGERKNISYAAWREAGVDPAVLKKAGIERTGNEK